MTIRPAGVEQEARPEVVLPLVSLSTALGDAGDTVVVPEREADASFGPIAPEASPSDAWPMSCSTGPQWDIGNGMSDRSHHDPVGTLVRWEDHGAVWRVVERTPSQVTVALYRCDGGEEVERMVSGDPELLAFVDGRNAPPPQTP